MRIIPSSARRAWQKSNLGAGRGDRRELHDGPNCKRRLCHEAGDKLQPPLQSVSIRRRAQGKPERLGRVRVDREGRTRRDRNARAVGLLGEIGSTPMVGKPHPEVIAVGIGRKSDIAKDRRGEHLAFHVLGANGCR